MINLLIPTNLLEFEVSWIILPSLSAGMPNSSFISVAWKNYISAYIKSSGKSSLEPLQSFRYNLPPSSRVYVEYSTHGLHILKFQVIYKTNFLGTQLRMHHFAKTLYHLQYLLLWLTTSESCWLLVGHTKSFKLGRAEAAGEGDNFTSLFIQLFLCFQMLANSVVWRHPIIIIIIISPIIA